MIRRIIAYFWNIVVRLYFQHVHPKLLPWYEASQPWLKTSQRYFGVAIILYLIVLVSLTLSFLLFGIFYFYQMPRISHTFPVDFQFKRTCIQDHRNFIASDERRKNSNFYDDCKPEALVLLSLRNTNKCILTLDQNYRMSLHLDVPETQRNMDVGMFMVTMETADAKTSKPASIKQTSLIVRLMKLLSWWMFYTFGFFEERQTVEVVLMDDFKVKSNCDSSMTYEARRLLKKIAPQSVQNIQRNRQQQEALRLEQEWNGLYCDAARITIDIPDIQLYSAHLKATAAFSGFQYVMYEWPITSFVFGTLSVFTVIMSWVVMVLGSLAWKYEKLWWNTEEGDEVFANRTSVDDIGRSLLEDDEESDHDVSHADTNSDGSNSSIEQIQAPADSNDQSSSSTSAANNFDSVTNIRQRR